MKVARTWQYGSLRWTRNDGRFLWQPSVWYEVSGEVYRYVMVVDRATALRTWVEAKRFFNDDSPPWDHYFPVRLRWRWMADGYARRYARRRDLGEWRIG